MNIDLIMTGIQQGLILALVAYAVMIPFRLLNFSDLSAEGAYPLGGAISAKLLIMGCNPIFASLLALCSSGLFCMGVSFLNIKFKLNSLLAGIILSTMIYSVNLRILGKPNMGLFNTETIFTHIPIQFKIIFLGLIVFVFISPLVFLLKTEIGLRLRAIGLNPLFSKRQGISIPKYQTIALFIAGCFSGLAGSLMIQLQNYMDIGMGIGIVIHALAALMIGESLVGNHTLNRQLMAPLMGALLYQQIQGAVLSLGLSPSDLKFFTGMIVLVLIYIQQKRKKSVQLSNLSSKSVI